MRKRFLFVSLMLPVLIARAQQVRINDDTGTAEQRDPVVAMNPYGPMVICWRDARNGNDDVYMQLFTRRGLPFLGNQRVNEENSTDDAAPDVAIDRHGQFVVVYTGVADGLDEIFYRRYYANGVPKGPSTVVPDESHRHWNTSPRIAMSSDGRFVIAWTRNRRDVFAKVFSYGGVPQGDDIPVCTPDEGTRRRNRIAMHENNTFMVVWLDERSGVPRVWGRLFGADASPITEPFEVSDPALDDNASLFETTVAAGANGEYLVLWKNGMDNRIYGRLVGPSGAFLGDPIVLCDNVFLAAFNISVASHPRWDLFAYAWIGIGRSSEAVYTNYFIPGTGTLPSATPVGSGWESPFETDVALANLFNAVYVWSDQRSGDYDIYAAWQGKKMVMRTTAASGFDGMVPISWDPPYAYTQVRPYHIHRMNPDGTREVIATVDPSLRPLPNQMLDYVDHDVVNGETYRYAVQLDGEPETQLAFVEATPSESLQPLLSQWADTPPTIDGDFEPLEWMDLSLVPLDIHNPESNGAVPLFVENDSSYLYICVVDPNDNRVDPGNSLGLVFDEDHDGRWEERLSIGEGMLILDGASRTFVSVTGRYPDGLVLGDPQPARGVDVAIEETLVGVVYECRIDLRESPLNASPGDTIGVGLWVKDPGQFYGWGQGNAGEWPQGALWEAPQTFGDLVIAVKPETYRIPFREGFAIDMAAADVTGDEQPELVVLTRIEHRVGLHLEINGRVYVFQWQDGEFAPILFSDTFAGTPIRLRVLDFDGDGSQDILFTCGGLKMLRNTGEGFEVMDLIPANLHSFVPLDFSGDGLLDVVAFHEDVTGTRIRFYRQEPGLDFVFDHDLEESAEMRQFEAINLDGDDRMDLLLGQYDTGELLLLRNDELGLTPVYRDTLSSRLLALETADFNQDGYDDFVACAGDSLLFFHNGGDGRFEKAYAAATDICLALEAVTMDSDPYPDLISAPMRGGLLLYHNLGGMDFEAIDAELASAISASIATTAGDFDGNGLIDIAFASRPVEVLFDAALRFGVPTRVVTSGPAAPTSFALMQNYPNPFNPTTTIAFEIPHAAKVELAVYDVLGRRVASLVNNRLQQGRYQVTFDASDLPSGVYFCRLRAGEHAQMRKMLLVR